MNQALRISHSSSREETLALGERLGPLLGAGDVVALIGPLGSGKTVLTKGIARGLGLADERTVTSPTFTLIHEYAGRRRLYHFDAYRLDGPGQMIELGCEEIFAGEGVSVVEWADRVAACLPEEYLEVQIQIEGPDARRFTWRPKGKRYVERLNELLAP